jgi:ATP-dependent RNA helicase DDX18/HAS1
MTAADIENKKRKRKHKSKKGEELAAAPEAQSNGTAPVEKPRKKAKKEHTPEPEKEDVEAEVSASGPVGEPEEDEAQVNEELKQIAAKAKVANVDDDEETEEVNGSGANNEALGSLPSGTSMPNMENPTRFEELKLSDRTMEAIKTMGFETMTEIQQKTIPPLLRYVLPLL